MNTKEQFDLWCIVELFGHTKVAGRCTEQSIAGGNMLRVEVPETKQQPAFTRFYGNAAIYAIHPVTEDVATEMASNLSVKPVQAWDIRQVIIKEKLVLGMSDQEDGDGFPS